MRHAFFIRATTLLPLLAVVLWSAFCFIPQAHAATVTITSCPTGTGLDNAVTGASPGGTIQFHISGSPCTIDLSGADGGGTLFIAKNLTFDASGSPQPVTLSGGHSIPVLLVGSGITFILNTLTIANGVDGTSGGIYNAGGMVTISSSTIANNSSSGSGGGILNGGTMTITNSTIANNSVSLGLNGGGILNDGTMTINNSTIANNSADNFTGGGIFNAGGMVTINNSTVVNNSATTGGGIYNGSTMIINNSTIANNSATGGGGIDNFGTVSIAQSIVANNGGGDCLRDHPITDQGYNLESRSDCGFTARTDLQNTNPQFQGGLQNNGGPTQTIALQPTSPAVDKIPVNTGPGCVAGGTDQRGSPRPDYVLLLLPETSCDIGAYEVQDLL